MATPQIGIYFYPWYNLARWREFPRTCTPSIGEYDSRDPAVLNWQLDNIAAAGIDYIIFEIVPQHDWGFPTMAETIERALPELRRRGLGWSFLIDFKVGPPGHMNFADAMQCISGLEAWGWTQDMVTGPTGKPLLFLFAPLEEEAREASRQWADTFDLRYPIWFPHWGHVDEAFFNYQTNPYRGMKQTLHEYFGALDFISFWESTEQSLNHGGFCSVTPGYDDTLMRRDPQLAPVVDRADGSWYRRQFEQALAHQPEHVLIYGWNEYFEGTTIEPTREYGLQYLELTRELIRRHVKPGQSLPPWPQDDLAGTGRPLGEPHEPLDLGRHGTVFDGAEPRSGFHDIEQDAEGPTIWTAGRFALQPTSTSRRIILELCYNGPAGNLELMQGDRAVQQIKLRQGWQSQTLDVAEAGMELLSFRVDPVPPVSADTRELGVRIRSVFAH
jgi:hypothetical protein